MRPIIMMGADDVIRQAEQNYQTQMSFVQKKKSDFEEKLKEDCTMAHKELWSTIDRRLCELDLRPHKKDAQMTIRDGVLYEVEDGDDNEKSGFGSFIRNLLK